MFKNIHRGERHVFMFKNIHRGERHVFKRHMFTRIHIHLRVHLARRRMPVGRRPG